MNRLLLAASLLLAGPVPVYAQTTDAYVDPAARALVAGARARRGTVDLSIREYRALSTDRVSVAHQLAGRERLLFRRETATRVHWRREGEIDLEVIGAREVSPVAGDGSEVPGDLADYLHVAFDPLDSEFLFRFDTVFVRHPFAAGSEQHYRFATGDSSTIRLPDGREIRLRELRVIPRRAEPQLVSGSFWLHTDSHAIVQATFRPANEYRMGMERSRNSVAISIGPRGRTKVPWYLKQVRGAISEISIDYGLWDLRWWLPRYMRVGGELETGIFGAVSMRYELSYKDYDVTADTTLARIARDSVSLPCRDVRRTSDVRVVSAPDSVKAAWERKAGERREARREAADSAVDRCTRTYRVSAPTSQDSLLASPYLPASIYDESALLSDHDAEQLARRLDEVPDPAVQPGRARLEWGMGGSGLVRFNRVEGLSVGARGVLELGAAEASLEARYGIADESPKGVARVALRTADREWRLLGYRDLRATDPALRPFSLASSLGALLFASEDALYYRATGAALEVAPLPARPQHYALRMYAERQSAAIKNTDLSLPHLLDRSQRARDNIFADRATQYGGELTLRAGSGLDPADVRVGAQLDVRAEAGTFQFVRPALTLRFNPPALGPLAPGLEAAAGTTFGDAPVQSLWYLGGARTLRAFDPGAAYGPAFWRGRAELATALPALRLALFTDAGWAGATDADAWRSARPLWSAGAGVSLLDGIVRLDVARAVRGGSGWGVHLYLGGLL